MADDPTIGQDEIEALLKKAQAESSGSQSAEAPAESAPAASGEQPASADIDSSSPAGAAPAAAATAPPASDAPAPAAKQKPNHADDDQIAQEDIDLLLQQAQDAIASVNDPVATSQPTQQFRLRDFTGAAPSHDRSTLELIRDVELDLKIELGRTHMPLEEVLKLRKGAVVPLEKLAGDPVDIFVNGRLIARGEVLVMNDNFCVRVAELIASEAVA